MNTNYVVLKFGGTSVSTRENWNNIKQLIEKTIAAGEKPVVVCSAVSQISNQLELLIEDAKHGEFEQRLSSIKSRHQTLADELGLSLELLAPELEELERLIKGLALIGEESPRLRARILSKGELMSTKLGAAFLNSQDLSTSWQDARDHLKAVTMRNSSLAGQFLNGVCDFSYDENLVKRFDELETSVIITQGFIAKNTEGSTVLLGRGGSDTSAAYFASKLACLRLEIWTSVPGMFTANPAQIPSARMLMNLDYEEAQELASSGAKVLHPRCIEPVATHKIPLHIKWTDYPDSPSTVISEKSSSIPQVKAISTKKGIWVVSMETMGMWQQSGFLADIFQVFKQFGLSVDLVSTSESNVTVTLDSSTNQLDEGLFEQLLATLSDYCRPTKFGPCASLSIVGKQIRSILHKLGPVLTAFEDKEIYVLSQAASDLNLTFTISEEESERLLKSLHELLFSNPSNPETFGVSWNALGKSSDEDESKKTSVSPWWEQHASLLREKKPKGRPAYVYNMAVVRSQIEKLKSLKYVDRINYAMKANSHPEILKEVEKSGLSFDCVSAGEIDEVLRVCKGIDPSRILFTPNFAPVSEYEYAFSLGVIVNLDNLFPLEHHPEIFADQKVMVRLDPGIAKGHHKHVRTAGVSSKFGVDLGQLEKLKELSKKHRVEIMGLHAHVGSGIKSPETWADTALKLAQIAETIPSVKVLDVGGGFGIAEKPSDSALDMESVDEVLSQFAEAYPQYKVWLEPGRFVVAEAGVLLTEVTQTKVKGTKNYVGVDTGMNSLIRPPLYGSYHHIANLSNLEGEGRETVDFVGPICESGDVLGHSRNITECKEGDIIAVACAGAYGKVMASTYNLRPSAEEVIIDV